jgi:hypothetical protein
MLSNTYVSKNYSILCPLPEVPVVHIINVSAIFLKKFTRIFRENAKIFAKMRKQKVSFQILWQMNFNITTHTSFILPQNVMLYRKITLLAPLMRYRYHCQIV